MKKTKEPKFTQGTQVRVNKEGHEHHGKTGELVGYFHGEENVRVPNPKAEPSHREYDPQQPEMIWGKQAFIRHAVQIDGIEKPVAIDEQHLEAADPKPQAAPVTEDAPAEEFRKGKRRP